MHKIYLVGGAVRDKYLGIKSKDQDYVVVGARPEIMTKAGYKQVGRDFPVFLHPKTHAEYALARKERKMGKGHQGFVCEFGPEVTLIEDLSRRDLTINAMAEDPDGTLIDPYNGLLDCQRKVLRHVSMAFSEDPLRVLRLARFATRFAPLGFTIAQETLNLARTMCQAGELASLSKERIWQEMYRSIMEPDLVSFFKVLRQVEALNFVWPMLDDLWREQAEHCLKTFQEIAKSNEEGLYRFAVILIFTMQEQELDESYILQFAKTYPIGKVAQKFCLGLYQLNLVYAKLLDQPASLILKLVKMFKSIQENLPLLIQAVQFFQPNLKVPDKRVNFILESTALYNNYKSAELYNAGHRGIELGKKILDQQLGLIDELRHNYQNK